MRIYGISGLGADERVFHKVNKYLKEPITYVPWLKPEADEPLKHYAHRMADTLDTSEPFALIGVSFGGMLSSEITKILSPERTVLISSAACRKELPAYFRGAGKLHFVPYIPEGLLKLPRPLMDVVSSLKEKEDRQLMHDIMQETDPKFLKWAVHSILTWDNDEIPKGLRRIHGDSDRLLPLKAKANQLVKGGHLVIIEKPKEMAGLIEKELS